jgi:nicotinate-nucleotide adenylyltransferase
MTRAPRRIGVYGGTFNPIHLGHLILAEEIRGRLGLDQVLFVPSNQPPHKSGRMPSGAERLAMVRLAIRGNPAFRALDWEVCRGGTSYTIETLAALGERGPAGTALFFLLGMDAFEEIGTWRGTERLPLLAHFVVFPRAGHPLADPRRFAPASWRLRAGRRAGPGMTAHAVPGGLELTCVETEVLSLSASAVRARAGRGESIRYLVPPAVERYVAGHGLYRGQPKGA